MWRGGLGWEPHRRQRGEDCVWYRNDLLRCTTGPNTAGMSGGVFGGAVVIVASACSSEAGSLDSGSGETRGGWFVHGLVGAVGGAWTGGCGDATGAFGTAHGGVAGTASGVAGTEVSGLASAIAAFSRCHRLVNAAPGSAMPASGDKT